MKGLLILLVAFMLGAPQALSAQKSRYVKTGVNYSTFRTKGGKSQPGIVIGAGKKFYPIHKFNGFWGVELGFVNERIRIKDKTWPTNFHPPYSGITRGGFEVHLNYIDFSILFGFKALNLGLVDAELFLGPCLAIPVKNNTKVTGTTIIYLDPEQMKNYEFDYLHYDADPGDPLLPFIERGMNINKSLSFGAKLYWKNLHLTLNYVRSFSKTEGIIGLTLFDYLDKFMISFGADF